MWPWPNVIACSAARGNDNKGDIQSSVLSTAAHIHTHTCQATHALPHATAAAVAVAQHAPPPMDHHWGRRTTFLSPPRWMWQSAGAAEENIVVRQRGALVFVPELSIRSQERNAAGVDPPTQVQHHARRPRPSTQDWSNAMHTHGRGTQAPCAHDMMVPAPPEKKGEVEVHLGRPWPPPRHPL